MLIKNKIVFCGALRYEPNQTTDGTAAEIARYLKTDMLINVTNIDGLYNKNPKTNKNARFISKISFDDFYKMVSKIKFKAGQHFVLDFAAAKIIRKNNIKTVIVGRKNLEKVLKGKTFRGTVIS